MTTFRRFTLLVAPRGNAELSTGGRSCPHCRSSVFHIARRIPDLLLSLFVPIERYRCISMQCNWEGNLRAKRSLATNLIIGGRIDSPALSSSTPPG